MHICVDATLTRIRKYEEEYPWNVALYIEIRLTRDKEITVCKHPSYTIIENLNTLVDMLRDVHGDEMMHVLKISNMLNNLDPEWRKDFEIIIRRNFISISLYL